MGVGGKGEAEETGTDFSETSARKAERRERLEISDEAVDKIIADVLGGAEGLASVFAGENVAGIFDSSVAAQASGDLAANLAGEIAKLKAEKIVTEEEQEDIKSREDTGRIFHTIGGGFGVGHPGG